MGVYSLLLVTARCGAACCQVALIGCCGVAAAFGVVLLQALLSSWSTSTAMHRVALTRGADSFCIFC
jgi:hypothetical protein